MSSASTVVHRRFIRMYRWWPLRTGHLVHVWRPQRTEFSIYPSLTRGDSPYHTQNNAYMNTFGNVSPFVFLTAITCLLGTLPQPGSNAQGAIVASMPAGSFAGALAVTMLADKIGRKKTIIISGLIWVIGSILQCASVVRLRSLYIASC